MATYPSFAQMVSSERTVLDDRVVDRAVSGAAKARSFYDALKSRFYIKHQLSTADAATLTTFYSDNRMLAFDFVWAGDGLTYTVIFESVPRQVPTEGAWIDVEVAMTEQ